MRHALVLAWLFAALPAPVSATPYEALCLAAARAVARETDVPYDVLAAISMTETGRARDGVMRTWPWTMNVEGQGHWFETRDQALRHAYATYRSGKRSFDIGCFQINFRWHGAHFASLDQMFEPLSNARYAARFLTSLHAEFGSWDAAAGAFHSRTEALAKTYRARFAAFRDEVTDTPPRALTPDPPRRTATLLTRHAPLVTTGAPGRLGSLVPLGASAKPLLGRRP